MMMTVKGTSVPAVDGSPSGGHTSGRGRRGAVVNVADSDDATTKASVTTTNDEDNGGEDAPLQDDDDVEVVSSRTDIGWGGGSSTDNGGETSTAVAVGDVVTTLTSRDVLLGRGTGPNEQPGNIYFRSLVRERLERQSTGSRTMKATHNDVNGLPPPLNAKVKARWAKEILDQVHSEGGRFLRIIEGPKKGGLDAETSNSSVQKSSGAGVGNIIGGRQCTFVKVSDAVALDKIKQSFRHQRRLLSPPVTTVNVASKGSPSQAATETPSPSSLMSLIRSSRPTLTANPNAAMPSLLEVPPASSLIHAALTSLDVLGQGGHGGALGADNSSLEGRRNPTLDALTATALNLERMKQTIESELIREMSNRLAATNGYGGHSAAAAGAAAGAGVVANRSQNITVANSVHAPSVLQTLMNQTLDPSTRLAILGALVGTATPTRTSLPQQVQFTQAMPPGRQLDIIQAILRQSQSSMGN